MKSYNEIINRGLFEEKLNSIKTQSEYSKLTYQNIQRAESRNINTIVDFFSTYWIWYIPSQTSNGCNNKWYRPHSPERNINPAQKSFFVHKSLGGSINQMYESNANQSSLFSEFRHNSSKGDRQEAIEIHGENSDSEWISTPPEYYNVKKANIAPMRDYNFETSYRHNKKTGRILRYFICKHDNCNRMFNKTWNFIDHVRIHTGEKPYV